MSWDERFSKGDHGIHVQPMSFLVALAERMDPGARVLDLACGTGRHAVLFAERGCKVTAVDSSSVALQILRDRDARVTTLLADVETYEIQEGAWDLIIVTMYLQRSLFPKMKAARVAMAIPLVDEREGVRPMNPDYLLRPGELSAYFPEPGWVHEYFEETTPDAPGRRLALLITSRCASRRTNDTHRT